MAVRKKKQKKRLLVCAYCRGAGGRRGGAKESELVGLWREAVTLQLHVPLQPVNAGFVGKKKDAVNQPLMPDNMGDKTKYAGTGHFDLGTEFRRSFVQHK